MYLHTWWVIFWGHLLWWVLMHIFTRTSRNLWSSASKTEASDATVPLWVHECICKQAVVRIARFYHIIFSLIILYTISRNFVSQKRRPSCFAVVWTSTHCQKAKSLRLPPSSLLVFLRSMRQVEACLRKLAGGRVCSALCTITSDRKKQDGLLWLFLFHVCSLGSFQERPPLGHILDSWH